MCDAEFMMTAHSARHLKASFDLSTSPSETSSDEDMGFSLRDESPVTPPPKSICNFVADSFCLSSVIPPPPPPPPQSAPPPVCSDVPPVVLPPSRPSARFALSKPSKEGSVFRRHQRSSASPHHVPQPASFLSRRLSPPDFQSAPLPPVLHSAPPPVPSDVPPVALPPPRRKPRLSLTKEASVVGHRQRSSEVNREPASQTSALFGATVPSDMEYEACEAGAFDSVQVEVQPIRRSVETGLAHETAHAFSNLKSAVGSGSRSSQAFSFGSTQSSSADQQQSGFGGFGFRVADASVMGTAPDLTIGPQHKEVHRLSQRRELQQAAAQVEIDAISPSSFGDAASPLVRSIDESLSPALSAPVGRVKRAPALSVPVKRPGLKLSREVIPPTSSSGYASLSALTPTESPASAIQFQPQEQQLKLSSLTGDATAGFGWSASLPPDEQPSFKGLMRSSWLTKMSIPRTRSLETGMMNQGLERESGASQAFKWKRIFQLQHPEGYWELTTELGEHLKVNVDVFANVFLKNKGINSLGVKAHEDILKLVATLLVLQLMRLEKCEEGKLLRTLFSLEEAPEPRSAQWEAVKRAVDWVRWADRQYPCVYSRLEFGLSWESSTRQLLGYEDIPPYSALYRQNVQTVLTVR